ncbi:MAG: metallophosphoesterase [Candidatus Koribacter versatilis]|uniref:Metallophosphoesterase n=1 Tax=Candidatus Korobacter versatilis TaxID=658062 RepID=A0A932A5W1_9BACT|nr:metallophosphoesterase [Candidatus Koribacter versatilis]
MSRKLLALATLALAVICSGLLSCVNDPHQLRPLQALPSTATLGAAADPDHFVFYVFGDNRPAKKSDPPTATIQQIADAIGTAKPALALSCGDLIAGKEPGEQAKIQAEYQAILDIFHPTGVPLYNAPGNHEMDDAKDVPNAVMTGYYEQVLGLPYGSFDYGNSHFVSLNTEEVASLLVVKSPRAPTDDGTADLDPGYVSPDQRQWLDEDLALHQSAAHVFIFMHHSIHPFKAKNALDKASADAITAILAKYPNVTAVFSAHEHLYYNVQSHDDLTDPMAGATNGGPRFLVTGGAGAPLQSNDHGFFHYFIVTVNAGDISISMVKL